MGIENGGAAFLATVVSDPETTFSIFDPFQAGDPSCFGYIEFCAPFSLILLKSYGGE